MSIIHAVSVAQKDVVRTDLKTSAGARPFSEFLTQADIQPVSGTEKLMEAYNVGRFGATLGAAINATEAVTIADVRAAHAEKSAALQAELGNLYRDEDILAEPMPQLAIGKDGAVQVVGDHPQKEAIERLFEKNFALRNRVAAVETDKAFIAEYDRSMRAGVRTAPPDFFVAFDAERLKVEFEQGKARVDQTA